MTAYKVSPISKRPVNVSLLSLNTYGWGGKTAAAAAAASNSYKL